MRPPPTGTHRSACDSRSSGGLRKLIPADLVARRAPAAVSPTTASSPTWGAEREGRLRAKPRAGKITWLVGREPILRVEGRRRTELDPARPWSGEGRKRT